MWFQQDGASRAHSKINHSNIRNTFPGKLILRFGDVSWPLRSPDFTPPDFFLWGYLKQSLYINRPNTLLEIKGNIDEEINRITPGVLEKYCEQNGHLLGQQWTTFIFCFISFEKCEVTFAPPCTYIYIYICLVFFFNRDNLKHGKNNVISNTFSQNQPC